MLLKIKKIFLSFFNLNRKTTPLLLLFIFLGALLPLHSAQATLIWLAQQIVSWLANAIFTQIAVVSGIIAFFPWVLLQFVTDPLFLNISYTTNEFVMLGWTITRNLANMFFILVLVVIALATILRIGDYQAKKTLPLLIIIALLINFTPVITGAIIDFFNLLRDFFLGEGIGINSLFWAAEGARAGVEARIRGYDWAGFLTVPVLIIGGSVLIVISNLILALIFLVYALLFMLRPIALMMLVILSPIAFLAYILPATRSFFTQWWNQFIQWCIIGAIAAFYLYLADQLAFTFLHGGLQDSIGAFTAPEGAEERWSEATGLIAGFVPIYLILGFMILGFFATITTSAAGATQMISFGRKAGKWAGKALAVKAGVVAAKKYPKYAHKFERWGEKVKERGEKSKIPIIGWAQRKIGAGTVVFGRETAVWGELKEKEHLKKIEERMKKETTAERISTIKTAPMDKRITALRAAIDEGESKDILKAWGEKEEDIKRAEDEVANIYSKAKAKGIDLEKDIACAFPHLHKKFGITASGDIDKLMGRIKAVPELIKKMHPDGYNYKKAPEITNRILDTWGGRQIAEAARSSDEARVEIENLFENRIKDVGFEELAEKNASAANYLASTAARGAGLRNVIHLTDDDVREILRKVKTPSTPAPGLTDGGGI